MTTLTFTLSIHPHPQYTALSLDTLMAGTNPIVQVSTLISYVVYLPLFRSNMKGLESATHRKATEAWEYLQVKEICLLGGWAPLQEAMWKFLGADAECHNLENAPLEDQSMFHWGLVST